MKILIAASFALALAIQPAAAQSRDAVIAAMETNFGDADPFIEAFEAIAEAVAADDAEALAPYIPYRSPFRVDGETIEFESEFDFYPRYEALFTDAIKAVIADQRFEDLFVNAEGVMYGSGEVWVSGLCTNEGCTEFEVKIITLQQAD